MTLILMKTWTLIVVIYKSQKSTEIMSFLPCVNQRLFSCTLQWVVVLLSQQQIQEGDQHEDWLYSRLA